MYGCVCERKRERERERERENRISCLIRGKSFHASRIKTTRSSERIKDENKLLFYSFVTDARMSVRVLVLAKLDECWNFKTVLRCLLAETRSLHFDLGNFKR